MDPPLLMQVVREKVVYRISIVWGVGTPGTGSGRPGSGIGRRFGEGTGDSADGDSWARMKGMSRRLTP